MNKLLVILGPTATGKTDLALYLAKKLGGELIACDSRQVYQGLDIGTGKLPGSGKWEVRRGRKKWEVGGVKIWMYDVVSLKKQYTVADFVNDANIVLENIYKKNKLPILIGGTGLYIKAIVEGLSSLQTPLDKKLRKKLINLSLRKLQDKLIKIDSKKWEVMNNSDRNNPRRIIRAIELATNLKLKTENLKMKLKSKNFSILKIGLTTQREILYEKINKRVYRWVKDGIIDEVINLRKTGISKERFQKLGLEYAVIVQYLEGRITYEQMIEKMRIKVRQYAKRQMTWFKKEEKVNWFDIIDKQFPANVEKKVAKWYHQTK